MEYEGLRHIFGAWSCYPDGSVALRDFLCHPRRGLVDGWWWSCGWGDSGCLCDFFNRFFLVVAVLVVVK